MLEILLICAGFGCFSGILAGLFGIGGGLVLVPFFVFLLAAYDVAQDLQMLIAVATSLATIVVTSMAATFMHHRLGAVIWKYVFDLSLGMVLGVMLGALLANSVASVNLQFIFALYMLYNAIHMALQSKRKLSVKPLRTKVLRVSGLMIGCVASVLGIGGGTLTVPLLVRRQLPMRNAVAISSACGLPIAIMGSLSYAYLGWGKSGLPVGSVGYIYLPAFAGIVISSVLSAPLGARLANKLPTQHLKRYFSLLLFFVAGKLLWAIFV